jgi:hypothetical protein
MRGLRDAEARPGPPLRTDRLAYTEGKTGFVLDMLDAAEAWARAVGWRLPDG